MRVLDDITALAWSARKKGLEAFLAPAAGLAEGRILARDSSLVTLIEIDGALSATGEEELQRFVDLTLARWNTGMLDPGHALHIAFERDPGLVLRRLLHGAPDSRCAGLRTGARRRSGRARAAPRLAHRRRDHHPGVLDPPVGPDGRPGAPRPPRHAPAPEGVAPEAVGGPVCPCDVRIPGTAARGLPGQRRGCAHRRRHRVAPSGRRSRPGGDPPHDQRRHRRFPPAGDDGRSGTGAPHRSTPGRRPPPAAGAAADRRRPRPAPAPG